VAARRRFLCLAARFSRLRLLMHRILAKGSDTLRQTRRGRRP
jgi:hypothetical protein